MDDITKALLALPKPRRRTMDLIYVPVYGGRAGFQIPADMTEQEARRLAAVLIAYSATTSYCPSRPMAAGRG